MIKLPKTVNSDRLPPLTKNSGKYTVRYLPPLKLK